MIEIRSAVGKGRSCMVYALTDGISNDYYLIDIGDIDAARSLLPKEAHVRGVFITHGHHDHIFGLNKLKVQHPGCIVYASEECAMMLSAAKKNLSAYIEKPFEYKGEVTILREGDKVQLFDNCILTAYETPGHNPSCLSFMVEDNFFTGDSYIPGVKVVTNLPGGNKRIAQETVSRILEIGKGKKICPGPPALTTTQI